jgi:glutaredoxin
MTVVIYTKEGCSLCDEALATVERVRERQPFDLRVVDLTTLPHGEMLKWRYDIPVVFVGPRVFKHRVTEQELRDALSGTSVAHSGDDHS